MARYYHVEIAAFAADADAKWVDNLLSHFDIDGVEGGRQGVARRVSVGAIRRIAFVRRLTRDLGISVDTAVRTAESLLTTDRSSLSVGDCLSLELDRDRLDADIDARIADAVESIVPARRGRPPARPDP